MFRLGAPWSMVAGHTKVIKFGPGNILYATDDELKLAFEDLERRGIALAVETSLLTKTPDCQQVSEAYLDSRGTLRNIMQRIRQNGGELAYIAMDEPFFYGHRFSGPNACHESAEGIASDIAGNLAIVRNVFPEVQIGDIEVVDESRSWIDELAHWADAYRAATGEALAFLHTDVDWSEPAISNLSPLAAICKARGIPFGILYNADADAKTDTDWTRSASEHFTEIETALGIVPDAAVFQTWVSNPSHMLPEGAAGTLTNLVLQYLNPIPKLSAMRFATGARGRLTDQQGQPVAGARIQLQGIDADGRMPPTVRRYLGTVPANAATAVVGIRVNLEDSCVCSGDAEVKIGMITFESASMGQRDVSPGAPVDNSSPDAVRTMELRANQTFAKNLTSFPVAPGEHYTLTVPLAATASAERTGYVTVIFLDAAGKGIRRDFIWFSPSRFDLGSTTTDEDGRFEFAMPPAKVGLHQRLGFVFSGNKFWRGAVAYVPREHSDDR